MTCPPQTGRPPARPQVDARVWDDVLRRLRAELPSHAFEAWIGPLAAQAADGVLRIACPSAFHRERVRERHLARIGALVAEQCAGVSVEVVLDVDPALRASLATPSAGADEAVAPPTLLAIAGGAPATPSRRERRSDVPGHGFEGFVSGPGNALAREACLALARGRQLAVSPLYLVAASGLGKTHLAAAVVAEVTRRGERAVYASAEQFTNELMASFRSQRQDGFKQRYREGVDVLVIEDVHFLAGKRQTQLELFHTLEHGIRRGGRVLLTAERLPRELPDFDAKLASLMTSGLCAEIEPPDADVRLRILESRAKAAGVTVPRPCLDRLVEAVPGSVRDLEAALVQVVASASLLGRPIDPALVELALRKVVPRAAARGLDPERVAEIVAAHFHTSASALASRTRRRDVLLPRQLAMYLCTRYTDASLQRIGSTFGRNHPSVANAVRAIERALPLRPALRQRLDALAEEIDALTGGRKGPRRARH